ncbi:hypothetical protein MN116_002911 [Schistosoma mekongi]|uniref:Uncharacterized protein n=1 Tax=Schistosoma mekongi TaxID=38744 RepID=A0AAE1ZGJ9_SCHME|nr:hypothetical protein MN116_002911 [Schistosoma mekongi]
MDTQRAKYSILTKRLSRKLSRLSRNCKDSAEEFSIILQDLIKFLDQHNVNVSPGSCESVLNLTLIADMLDENLFRLLSEFHHTSGKILTVLTQPSQPVENSPNASSPSKYDFLAEGSVEKYFHQPLDEEYFSQHLFSRTRLLCMLETNVGALEAGLLSQISYLEGTYTANESIPPNSIKECLKHLEVECTNLASELATLNQSKVMQLKSKNELIKKQNQLKHMNDIEKILRQENSWLRFMTNLVDLEHNSCNQASDELISISQSLLTLQDYRVQLLKSSSSLCRSDDCDESIRNKISKYFEDAVIHLLQTSPLPPEHSEKLKTNENRSEVILDILRSLKSKLVLTKDAIKSESDKLNTCIQQTQQHLLDLKQTFDLPNALTLHESPSPHHEQLNPERIRFAWRGLCSQELTDLFTNVCQDINDLIAQMDSLELEADVTFPRL